MKYWKLFIPIPIVILLMVLGSPFERQNYYPLASDIVKGGLIIYYLRLDNSNTPLINSLTIILLFMMVGENLYHDLSGRIFFIISNMSLGLTYFFRQRLKTIKDGLAGLKTFAVFIYSLANVLYSFDIIPLMLVVIGVVFLSGIYLYDRLLRIDKT